VLGWRLRVEPGLTNHSGNTLQLGTSQGVAGSGSRRIATGLSVASPPAAPGRLGNGAAITGVSAPRPPQMTSYLTLSTVAAATVAATAVESTTVESAKGMATAEMSSAEAMAEEMVPAIVVAAAVVTKPPAANVRPVIRSDNPIPSASAK
jgi:hypothetical protein